MSYWVEATNTQRQRELLNTRAIISSRVYFLGNTHCVVFYSLCCIYVELWQAVFDKQTNLSVFVFIHAKGRERERGTWYYSKRWYWYIVRAAATYVCTITIFTPTLHNTHKSNDYCVRLVRSISIFTSSAYLLFRIQWQTNIKCAKC